MSVRKRGSTWWVDFSFDGVRYRRRSPENSKAGASSYELVLRQRLAKGDSLDRRNEEGRRLTFAAAADEWLKLRVATNAKPSVLTQYKKILSIHLLPRFGARPLGSMAVIDVERFKAEQLQRGLSPKTVNNHLIVLSGLFRSAREFGWTSSAPRIVWLKVPPQRFDFLSPEESTRLLHANRDSRWHDMMLCALRTGMRAGELLALRWSAVNFESRVITVSRSIVRGVEGSPKNNRMRHIPLATDLHEALNGHTRVSQFVFGFDRTLPATLPMANQRSAYCL